MIKMPCLFVRVFDGRNKPVITSEVTPGCEWVINGEGTASRKWDGTACAVIEGMLYKRYDAKGGKAAPVDAIPCQPAPDATTGHWPHWIKVAWDSPADKWHIEAWRALISKYGMPEDGTYELCGPAIGANAEGLGFHEFMKHGDYSLELAPRNFDGLHVYLTLNRIEGIVFLHPDGRRCKIRRDDFGLEWGNKSKDRSPLLRM